MDGINYQLRHILHDITHSTDFFGYYRLNLYDAQCPILEGNMDAMCGNRACAVDHLDESEVPEIWRASSLGRLSGPTVPHPSGLSKQQLADKKKAPATPLGGAFGSNTAEMCVFVPDDIDLDRDYCIPEDFARDEGCVYVSLTANPERFTGYAGPHAHRVWQEIYRKNCFSMYDPNATFHDDLAMVGHAANDLGAIVVSHPRFDRPEEDSELELLEDICLEKRIFWRVISGMHASISSHLCWDYLNQTTGQWAPNLDCYVDRLGQHPERVENIYFNYLLLLRAISKLSRSFLPSYTYCLGDPTQDAITQEKVLELTSAIGRIPQTFDESLMFDPLADPGANVLKDEFRARFRNVSSVMDCVGCDKCRLWGKVQVAGYGAALKVLFEDDADEPVLLRKPELVALVNTFDRLSHSIYAIGKFERMLKDRSKPKMPPKVPVYTTPTFRDSFEHELAAVWGAFCFIIHSYIVLPSRLWHIALYNFNRIWDHFVLGTKSSIRLEL